MVLFGLILIFKHPYMMVSFLICLMHTLRHRLKFTSLLTCVSLSCHWCRSGSRGCQCCPCPISRVPSFFWLRGLDWPPSPSWQNASAIPTPHHPSWPLPSAKHLPSLSYNLSFTGHLLPLKVSLSFGNLYDIGITNTVSYTHFLISFWAASVTSTPSLVWITICFSFVSSARYLLYKLRECPHINFD